MDFVLDAAVTISVFSAAVVHVGQTDRVVRGPGRAGGSQRVTAKTPCVFSQSAGRAAAGFEGHEFG